MARTRNQSAWHDGNVDKTLQLAEGLLTKLRDTPPERRPDQTVAGFLAKHYGCSVQRMKSRKEDAEAKRTREDEADLWLETIYQIGNELGETLLAKTFAIARDTSNRNALNAQKYLLPKIDPQVFGESEAQVVRAESRSLISDIPQEVFDELTDEEEGQVVEIEQAVAQQLTQLEQLIRRVQKRIAEQRVVE